jgi:Leucine-rich repeat (LRR) protein
MDCDLIKVALQVGNNQLTSLPPELGLLANLKLLFVRHSRQTDRDLTGRSQAHYNQLTSLPAIGQLTQLEHLFVRTLN